MEIHPNQEALELLNELELFKEMDQMEKMEMAAMLSLQLRQAGDVICHEGDDGGELFILKRGTVEVLKERPHGAGQIVIARFARGGVLGEMALLDNRPRSATVVATSEMEMYVLSRESLEELSIAKPPLAMKFFRGIAKLLSLRLRETSGLFADVF